MDRRRVLKDLALGAAGFLAGCKLGPQPEFTEPSNGRIDARPSTQTGFPPPGARPLLLQAGRDGRLYVPPGLSTGTPAPLVLALHGATGSGQSMLENLSTFADQLGFVMLCPDSRGVTWDAIRDLYAADVRFVNDAMAFTFAQCNIDPHRIGIVGFSDGASYSLGLGRLNGDLFHRVVAFSPGMLLQATDAFRPEIYITHGYRDSVLPMDNTSIPIVEELQARGYQVTFRKFDGGHWMPLAFVPEALRWVSGGQLDQEEAGDRDSRRGTGDGRRETARSALGRRRAFRDHANVVVQHLEESAGNLEPAGAPLGTEPEFALPQQRHHGRVLGKDAHFTVERGRHEAVDGALEQHLLG